MLNYFTKTSEEKEQFHKDHPNVKKWKDIYLPAFLYPGILFAAAVGCFVGLIIAACDKANTGALVFLAISAIISSALIGACYFAQKIQKNGLFIHLLDQEFEFKNKDAQKDKIQNMAKDKETTMAEVLKDMGDDF